MSFQLGVATILMSSVCGSLGVLYLTRIREGKLHLSDETEEPQNTLSGYDPFDMINADDILEGYPIESDRFWKGVRRRKLFVSTLLLGVIAIDGVSLGQAMLDISVDEIAIHAFNGSFAAYMLILTVCSINQTDASRHSKYVLHLTTLCTVATVLLGTNAILPASPPIIDTEESVALLRKIQNIKLCLFLLASFIMYTTPQGPRLHFPPERIFSEKTILATTNKDLENVCGVFGASPWSFLYFSYTSKVIQLGSTSTTLEAGDLPILPANMRASYNFPKMRRGMKEIHLHISSWRPTPGSGWALAYRLFRLNFRDIMIMIFLTVVVSILFYAPAIFLRKFLAYLEVDEIRKNTEWGWFYVIGLMAANMTVAFATAQLWSWLTTVIQIQAKLQLNTMLFAKTLVRKDVASSAPPSSLSGSKSSHSSTAQTNHATETTLSEKEDEFSSKAQVMNLMTIDVDRIGGFAYHVFLLISAPVEIAIGTILIYALLGVSSLVGLAAAFLLLPLNHFAGKIVVRAQESLMKARDERVALMNEILGAIKMLKFMAWERKFERKVLTVREKELKSQRLNYTIETLWNTIWAASPILVTLVSFWHFTAIRHQTLSPSIAFTSLIVFNEMKFPLITLPEAFINALQAFVSLRRIERYMNKIEVPPVPPVHNQSQSIAFQSCTVTWPQDHSQLGLNSPASAPKNRFILSDLTLNFPQGEISLVCGKLGSGKSLLLLSLLGEADILAGTVLCPRSPPDSIASFAREQVLTENWIVQGICAYVPQTAWLRNASIKDNILFSLPYNEERYRKTLQVCALMSDLEILEDGDESEIGERGVNLSGGQKARVSLARAVYSRASILFLDDVLSAVDAHTAHYLYHQCLKGELMQGRTIILVSHHVQLCVPGASYIVALDNGRVLFEGASDNFENSVVMQNLVHAGDTSDGAEKNPETLEENVLAGKSSHISEAISTQPLPDSKTQRKLAKKFVEEEKRVVGTIGRHIWETYIKACGGGWYWALFLTALVLAAIGPIFENGWLRHWASTGSDSQADNPTFYISVYAGITGASVAVGAIRFFILYSGSIRASTVLYKRILESILFANIRFHDTVSRGRLLNRLGKDFEGIDSNLADNFGRTLSHTLGAAVSIVTICFVGGYRFAIAICILGVAYYKTASMYRLIARDMRWLDSVTRSPLYTIYGETISGVAVLRAFGASSKYLRDMLCYADTNNSPFYWTMGVNRWITTRFNLLSGCVSGITALAALLSPSISASTAGFALTFAYTMTFDIAFMIRRFVSLEQSMVALERIKEYAELDREAPEFSEFQPSGTWPSAGAITCQDLVIRYAPDLPDVLHELNFDVLPGEKIGILGRTGSGKSTLALSFFRFVEPTKGRILLDDINIADVGLTDLRSKLTIIPQDPTILSGSLRSVLDVFEEYEDADIFEALRRVHLIPSGEATEEATDAVNTNVFRDLDSAVSEGGENFSTGEKQLLCMARAILKRSKILIMDEATASVDYATDQLIGKTIRQEFAESTILTIAHRLRTVIDYDKVMLLDNGQIIEYDRPSVLLRDPTSMFYSLCQATGLEEFAMLKKIAGV